MYDDGTRPCADPSLAEWTGILDAMESAAQSVEDFLHQPGDTFTMPRIAPGPSDAMPPEVQGRALILADRQERLMKAIEEARVSIQRQLQAVSSVPGIGQPPAAVYLDISG
jgi:hypothetical protein